MSVFPPTPTVPVMHGGADRRKAKRPPNVGSRELNSQENEMLFQLVGSDAVSLTAAVVQLLKSDRGAWRVEQPHGIISLVKDYAQRAYFLRIFDILDERVVWDFKLYKAFRAQSFPQCRKLLAFEQTENGDDGVVVGLNFFSEYEAAEFKEHLDRRHAQERKSTTNGGARPGMPMNIPSGIGVTPTRQYEITQAYGGTIRGPPIGIGGGQGITPMGTMAAAPQSHTQSDGNSSSSGGWFKNKNKKKDKKFKIKKEDISNPTNFQHKAHVGWNQDSGFSNTVYDDDMDEATKNILKAAGLESNNLNEDDKKFVKKFIAKNYDKYVSVGNLDPSQISAPIPAQQYQQQQAPTPQSWNQNQTPVRPYKPAFPQSAPIGSYQSSPAAPPPPTRVESHGLAPARPPPPPPTNNRGYAPSRPLPSTPSYNAPETRPHAVPPPPPPPPASAPAPAPISSNAPPPPPPPPPMPVGGIAPISGGAPPPPPPPPPMGGAGGGGAPSVLASLPPAQNGRSNLLAEIQAGKQLRSVQQTTETPKSGDARGDVMAQIRQGAQLKHVDAAAEQERRKSTTAGAAGMGGLAGALAKALEERRMNMGIDDSSDEDEDEDDKNEWSD